MPNKLCLFQWGCSVQIWLFKCFSIVLVRGGRLLFAWTSDCALGKRNRARVGRNYSNWLLMGCGPSDDPLITRPKGRFGIKPSRPRAWLIPPNSTFLGPKRSAKQTANSPDFLLLVTNHFAGSWHRLSTAELTKVSSVFVSSGQLGISCKVQDSAKSSANS